MSLIFVFVVVWGVVIGVWLLLDWLGDPGRGRFRPQRDHRTRGARSWRERRSLRMRREDAQVRAVLRDRFGRSSLRLHWTEQQELDARGADDDVVTMSHTARPIPMLEEAHLPLAPVVELYDGRVDQPPDDQLPDTEDDTPHRPPDDQPPDTEDDTAAALLDAPDANEEENEADEQVAAAVSTDDEGPPSALPARGWRVGDDPLAATRRGTPPAPATVRSRVWKNLAPGDLWDDENRERMRSGRPPRRRNPLNGRMEKATVDTDAGTVAWPPGPATDPFADPPDGEEEAT